MSSHWDINHAHSDHSISPDCSRSTHIGSARLRGKYPPVGIARRQDYKTVPLSVIEVSERVRAALAMGELVLCIVVIDFRALCGFLFQAVSDQVIGILFLLAVLYRTDEAVQHIVRIAYYISHTVCKTAQVTVAVISVLQQCLSECGLIFQQAVLRVCIAVCDSAANRFLQLPVRIIGILVDNRISSLPVRKFDS